MRKFLVCALVVFSTAGAYGAPKAEVFGGYQSTHFDGGPNANGWNAAITGNLNSWLGVTADVSGVYPTGFDFTTYTFGPQISAPLPVIKPFAHLLLGGARLSAGGNSINGFDLMIGGGFDAGHGPFAWRIVQFDWMSTRFHGFTDNKNVRVSTGIVLRF